jgi:hypothetical protein
MTLQFIVLKQNTIIFTTYAISIVPSPISGYAN